MNKINIGVIGTGHLGKLHTKMFKEIEACNLIGIFDSNQEQAESAGKEFGVNLSETIDDLLDKVDAVSIAATISVRFVSAARGATSRRLGERRLPARLLRRGRRGGQLYGRDRRRSKESRRERV